ncbi:MAG: DUF362 domain-containing protein, partial [candidate division Zixibacteria bacterium]|nr:DUF362 domain-containing protein [candidate division Zixibacteria bacterium]
MSKIKVALLKADSYKPELLKEKILKLLELIDFDIPVEKKITLVNPNLLSAKEPERAITTHPNVARTVVDIFSNNTGKLYVGDSPGGADRGVMRVWRNTGLLDVLKDSNSELYSFEGNPVATVNFNGSEFHISDIREK